MNQDNLIAKIESGINEANKTAKSLAQQLSSDVSSSADDVTLSTKKALANIETKSKRASQKLEQFRNSTVNAREDAKIGLQMAFEDLKSTINSIQSRFQ